MSASPQEEEAARRTEEAAPEETLTGKKEEGSEEEEDEAAAAKRLKPPYHPKEAIEELVKKASQYDYIRYTFVDLSGVSRGRVAPGRHSERIMKSGWGLYEGALHVGARSEMPPELYREHLKCMGETLGNGSVFPDPNTLHDVPWAGCGKYKVGEVMCDLYTRQGRTLDSSPRFVAQKQLQRLDEMGLQFLSSFEFEFILEDVKTTIPVFDSTDIFTHLFFAEHEKMFFQIDQQMLQAGINCEMMQTEYCPGQFEITMIPQWNMAAVDKGLQLKYGIKEIAHQYGYEANFMGKPNPEYNGNGAHFNFSVWTKNENENGGGTQKKNVFYDPSDKEHGLSTFARHWIAGTMIHAKALAAIQCPTVNCYRRFLGEWAPDKVFWGVENRNAVLRIKTGGSHSTYMENRLPSGSMNPHLVLASTIAAGLDGVVRQLEPPPEGILKGVTLPSTLGEALDCLQDDKSLVDALGPEFVKWFCCVKRLVDVETLKDIDITKNDPKALARERWMYGITI